MKILTKGKETREDEHWTELEHLHPHVVSSYVGRASSIYHIQYTMLIIILPILTHKHEKLDNMKQRVYLNVTT
jgi:hypothetical protein